MSASLQRGEAGVKVSGGMTLETAAALLAEGTGALAVGEPSFDLAGVDDIDSSGLAVLFGWQRVAQAQGKALRIENPPPSLISLAQVYGVADLLSLS